MDQHQQSDSAKQTEFKKRKRRVVNVRSKLDDNEDEDNQVGEEILWVTIRIRKLFDCL